MVQEEKEISLYKNCVTLDNVQFEQLINCLPIAVMIGDRQGNLVFKNNYFLKTIGYPQEEIATLDDWFNLACVDVPQQGWSPKMVESPLKKKKDIAEKQYLIKCLDGKARPFEIWKCKLVEKSVLILKDISERKSIESELLLETDRFKTLVDIAGQINAQRDIHSIFTFVCESAARLINVPVAIIFIFNEETQCLHFSTSYGLPKEIFEQIKPIPISVVKEMELDQNIAFVPNFATYRGGTPNSNLYVHLGVTSLAKALMVQNNNLIGSLQIFNLNQERQFNPNDIELLRGLADLSAQAIINMRLYDELNSQRDDLNMLSQQLVELLESRKRAISRELHDEIGQDLTGLNYTLESIIRIIPGEFRPDIELAQSIVNHLVNRVRELSSNLRPVVLDDFGLLLALLSLIDNYEKSTQIQVQFKQVGLKNLRVSESIEITSYRIIQEALTNISRHAQVKKAFVFVNFENNTFHIEIKDDGIGFNEKKLKGSHAHVGLSSMKERVEFLGGKFSVQSKIGLGTKLIVDIPV